LWRQWMARDMAIQPLLIPEPIDLTVAQYTLMHQYRCPESGACRRRARRRRFSRTQCPRGLG
jgi:hypothetical protein